MLKAALVELDAPQIDCTRYWNSNIFIFLFGNATYYMYWLCYSVVKSSFLPNLFFLYLIGWITLKIIIMLIILIPSVLLGFQWSWLEYWDNNAEVLKCAAVISRRETSTILHRTSAATMWGMHLSIIQRSHYMLRNTYMIVKLTRNMLLPWHSLKQRKEKERVFLLKISKWYLIWWNKDKGHLISFMPRQVFRLIIHFS